MWAAHRTGDLSPWDSPARQTTPGCGKPSGKAHGGRVPTRLRCWAKCHPARPRPAPCPGCPCPCSSAGTGPCPPAGPPAGRGCPWAGRCPGGSGDALPGAERGGHTPPRMRVATTCPPLQPLGSAARLSPGRSPHTRRSPSPPKTSSGMGDAGPGQEQSRVLSTVLSSAATRCFGKTWKSEALEMAHIHLENELEAPQFSSLTPWFLL